MYTNRDAAAEGFILRREVERKRIERKTLGGVYQSVHRVKVKLRVALQLTCE